CLSSRAVARGRLSFPPRRSSDLVATALPMPRTCDQFLAGSAFTGDQDRSAGRRDLRKVVLHAAQCVALADHLIDGVVRVIGGSEDRKSTRLNSSHVKISYAGFCL